MSMPTQEPMMAKACPDFFQSVDGMRQQFLRIFDQTVPQGQTPWVRGFFHVFTWNWPCHWLSSAGKFSAAVAGPNLGETTGYFLCTKTLQGHTWKLPWNSPLDADV